ncbi:MAG: hypothetical protein SFU91_11430 [Chloroherpetonaceae bacterium]|nr:hypothetical protein [Chloroherpetonaceae bacterium]
MKSHRLNGFALLFIIVSHCSLQVAYGKAPIFIKAEYSKDTLKPGDTLFVKMFLYKSIYASLQSKRVSLEKYAYGFGFLKGGKIEKTKTVIINGKTYKKEHISTFFIIPKYGMIDTLNCYRVSIKTFENQIYKSSSNTNFGKLTEISIKSEPIIIVCRTEPTPTFDENDTADVSTIQNASLTPFSDINSSSFSQFLFFSIIVLSLLIFYQGYTKYDYIKSTDGADQKVFFKSLSPLDEYYIKNIPKLNQFNINEIKNSFI